MTTTHTPLYDALVEEQGYTPGAVKLRTHKEFLADHPRPSGNHRKELPAPRPPVAQVAKKTAAKKTQPAKAKP